MIEDEIEKSIRIKGLVIPCRWDNDGNVNGIAVAGFDENNYPLLMDEVGKRLMSLLHKEVEISGDVLKTNNSDTIKVKKYMLSKNI